MKKILLLLSFICIAATSYSQVYFGGSLGLWRDGDADRTSFTLLPEAGYTLNDHWAVGASFGYKYSKADVEEFNTIQFSPYARYSFLSSGMVKCFVDGSIDLAGTSNVNDDHSSTSWGVGLKPGLAINLTRNLCLVAHIGFLGFRHAGDYPRAGFGNGFGLDLSGESLTFGLYYSL